jgi:3-oxoadipate enol-lactonase
MPVAELGEVSLFYRDYGTHHGGVPVQGIMGFALDHRFWAAQVPAITEHHRFLTFDNRGTGRSSGPEVTTIEEMAGDALALVDHLGLHKVVLFGVSMGGAVAQRLALDHPERVHALVLVATWARRIEFMRRQNDLARMVIEMGGAEALIQSSLIRMFTPSFFEVGEETIDRMVSSFLASGPELPQTEVLLAQLDAISKHETLDRLSEIQCPTLVVGGRMDMMVPGFASEEIAEAIPGAQLEMFDTGHACMIEEMEAFNARIQAFLGGLT